MKLRGFVRLTLPLAGVMSMAAADLQLSINPREGGESRSGALMLYAPGEVVSGIQFDIAYDPGAVSIKSVQPADTLGGQEKVLTQSEPQPGILRIIIIGMNTYPMLNGAIAAIEFTSSSDASAIRVVHAIATNPQGGTVELNPTDASAQSRSTPVHKNFKPKKRGPAQRR
jgi:hypothetical protein